MDESTFPLKDCLLSAVVRPTVCVFKWFHTSSSGFRSGEYGGRKNNRKAPPRLSTKALVLSAMRGTAIDDQEYLLCRAAQ